MRRPAGFSFGPLGWLALGVGLAAAGFTLFDPRRGGARRAMIRDKVASRARKVREEGRGLLIHAADRIRGAIHETRARFDEGGISDSVLEDRVRAQMGRAVSHPGGLRIKAVDGCIEIAGPVLRHEVDGLVDRIRSVRGVKDVVERLDVHDEPGNEPALQGAGSRQAR
jgi:hypothetical protein